MAKDMKFILVILVASLLLNLGTYSKMNNLNERLRDYEKTSTIINHELFDIRNLVHEVKKQQQWITPVSAYPGLAIDGKEELLLNWQIKDYSFGSPVTFFYRKIGDLEFQKIVATPQENGKFQVEIEIEQKIEPVWSVEYKDEILCKYQEDSISFIYEYYVTLDEGNRLKSSDLDKVNLNKFVEKYASIEVWVEPNRKNNEFEIKMYFDDEKLMPEKSYLEIYNGDQLVEIKELEDVDGEDNERIVSWKAEEEKEYDRLCISVEYKNHEVFKKEIWNKEISERS